MSIYYDVDVIIKIKGKHVKKINGKIYSGFHKYYGDVPFGRINKITKKFEQCVNNRGKAYALRNAFRYKKRKTKNEK